MVTKKASPLFQVGDRVKIRHSDWGARIVEFRGALAPGGRFVYRVRVPAKPKPIYIELPEDELTDIPTRPKENPNPSASQGAGTTGLEGDEPALPKVTSTPIPLFRVGDRVKIRQSNWRGRIVELRVPRVPGGVYVYRVRVPAKPKPIYIELPEDYLIAIPAPVKASPSPSTRRRVKGEPKGDG